MIRALPAWSEEPAEWAGSRCGAWLVQQVGLLTRFLLGLEAERQAGGQSSARPCLLT